jgi:heme-degrading monooxygenase HmoA
MISRHWRCIAKRTHADEYIQHLNSATFPALRRIPGFVSVSLPRRDVATGVEFIVITSWDSVDAIGRFAGTDAEVAVVPPQAQAMMVEFDARARHFQVVQTPA